MGIVPKNDKETKSVPARRRRKKRRTEDFSDSSDSSDSSSSSSSDDDEEDHVVEEKEVEEIRQVDDDGDVVLDDKEINIVGDKKFEDVKAKLKTVTLTKTALNDHSKNYNTSEVESTLTRNRKELENDYLGLMFENYGDDMNDLRNAPDFNERSLGILANALKNGSNIFDVDTLRAVVKK